ncbi:MAG: general secretion pathway protein GspK [Candidatus Omnitrophica bacterium]|nr:general secretion pathway protein GspK [Candidatus Omnitrophota bacterium]
MLLRRKKQGSILIFTLWVLSFLVILSAYIGLSVRQKILVLSKIESRSSLRHLTEAGVKKSIAALRQDLRRNKFVYTPYGKLYRHNNPERFSNVELGEGIIKIQYDFFDGLNNEHIQRYGLIDEESKINLNTADFDTLARLIRLATPADEKVSAELAGYIIDWRQPHERELTGFDSEGYYKNLENPYDQKNTFFERIEELLLVKGMTKPVYEGIKPYVTVYGDGMVNVNTASRIVLIAIGFTGELADKLLVVRQGFDEVDATVDDFIFYQPFDIAIEMKKFIQMDVHNFRLLDALNNAGRIKTNSSFFYVRSEGSLKNNEQSMTVECVYNVAENKIEYWREK